MNIARSGSPTGQLQSAGTTLTVTIPADANPGDFCFIFCFSNQVGPWGTNPVGFSPVSGTDNHAQFPVTIVYSKQLAPGDPGTTVTVTNDGTSGVIHAIAACWSNVGGIDTATNVFNTPGSTTATIPSVSAVGPNEMLVMFFNCGALEASFGSPSFGTVRATINTGVGSWVGDGLVATAGATGTETISPLATSTTSVGVGILLLMSIVGEPENVYADPVESLIEDEPEPVEDIGTVALTLAPIAFNLVFDSVIDFEPEEEPENYPDVIEILTLAPLDSSLVFDALADEPLTGDDPDQPTDLDNWLATLGPVEAIVIWRSRGGF